MIRWKSDLGAWGFSIIFPREFNEASRRHCHQGAGRICAERINSLTKTPRHRRGLGVAFFVSSTGKGKRILPWSCQDS